jgi:hypothetical protein
MLLADIYRSIAHVPSLKESVFGGGSVQRIFAKLNAIQDAVLVRSSSQEAELQFLHNEDISDGPISLSDNDDYGSISRRSSPCISTKSLPLDESGYPSDGSTPCRTDSPHPPSHAPSNQNTP